MKKNSRKYIKELDIGDPIEHWIQRAHKRAKVLKLPINLINDSAAIVVNALGRRWLDENFAKPDKSFPFPDKNPIVHDFEVAGDLQIVTIMEIAEYLRFLATTPGINKVLTMLKNKKQYFSSFLQIAYAYRFLKLGASEMVFEPPVDEGRHSDIFFLYKNQHFLVECFCPKYNDKEQDSFQDILKYSVDKLFDAAKKYKTKIFYYINFYRKITPQERKKVINLCITSLSKLISQGAKEITLNHDSCEIHIYNAGEIEKGNQEEYRTLITRLESESDFGCNAYLVAASQLEKVRNTFNYKRIETSRLFMRRPPEEENPEWIVDLGRKIEEKIAQVRRRLDNPRGVLIVNSEIGLLQNKIDEIYARRLQYKILKTHENIDAVILTSHKWMVHRRNQLIAALLLGPETILFDHKETLTMNFLEDTVDLLKGWPTLDADKFTNLLIEYLKGNINDSDFR